MRERCKPHKAQRHTTKRRVINDIKLFPTVHRRIYFRIFWRYPIRHRVTKSSALECFCCSHSMCWFSAWFGPCFVIQPSCFAIMLAGCFTSIVFLVSYVFCSSFSWCHGLVYSVIVVFLNYTQLPFWQLSVLRLWVSCFDLLLIHCCLGFILGPEITIKWPRTHYVPCWACRMGQQISALGVWDGLDTLHAPFMHKLNHTYDNS